jgi:hypothetical protein
MTPGSREAPASLSRNRAAVESSRNAGWPILLGIEGRAMKAVAAVPG